MDDDNLQKLVLFFPIFSFFFKNKIRMIKYFYIRIIFAFKFKYFFKDNFRILKKTHNI